MHTQHMADPKMLAGLSGNLPLVTATVAPLGATLLPMMQPQAGIMPLTQPFTWHVAKLRPSDRDVRRARNELAQRGYRTYDPRFVIHGRNGAVLRRFFVGYLLFAVRDGHSWGEASRAHGILSVICDRSTGRAETVPSGMMDRWRKACGPYGVMDRAPKVKGPARVIPAGTPLTVSLDDQWSLEAIMDKDDGERVRVMMAWLGGERLVEMPRSRVKILSVA